MIDFNPYTATINRIPFASTAVALPALSHAVRRAMPSAGTAWRLTGPSAAIIKRTMDVLIGAILLLVLALPMCLIALAIKLDSPGPALFRQRRTGHANRPFELLKFRTMYHQPPQHGRPSPHGRLRQATRRDPRVTRIGALLRQTSLDELPQFLHVLSGRMSLVGPRPHAPGTCAGGTPFEHISDQYPLRHQVRPGMTGLAQVRGWRGETDTREKLIMRLASDLEYIESWRPALDFVILARTVGTVLSMHNAY